MRQEEAARRSLQIALAPHGLMGLQSGLPGSNGSLVEPCMAAFPPHLQLISGYSATPFLPNPQITPGTILIFAAHVRSQHA